jgi:hypothetical protein
MINDLIAPHHSSFQEKYKALVWSNPHAAPEVFIRKALLQADFNLLLDAAIAFGLPELNKQWDILECEKSPEAMRASSTTTRILRNLQNGYQQAHHPHQPSAS